MKKQFIIGFLTSIVASTIKIPEIIVKHENDFVFCKLACPSDVNSIEISYQELVEIIKKAKKKYTAFGLPYAIILNFNSTHIQNIQCHFYPNLFASSYVMKTSDKLIIQYIDKDGHKIEQNKKKGRKIIMQYMNE